MKIFGLALFLALLSGCGTFVPVEDLSEVPPEQLQKALHVRVFTLESGAEYPEIKTYLGEVSAYSCKHMTWDPPASKGDALKRLRLEALRKGADAVIDVTFDTRGTDAWGTNCWQSVYASGQAVVLK